MDDAKERAGKLIVLPALAGWLRPECPTSARADAARIEVPVHAKGKDKCSLCTLFIPGKTATADGGCKVITGAISPNGCGARRRENLS